MSERKRGFLDKLHDLPGVGGLVDAISEEVPETETGEASSTTGQTAAAPVAPAGPVSAIPSVYSTGVSYFETLPAPSPTAVQPSTSVTVADPAMVQKLREAVLVGDSAYTKFTSVYQRHASRGKITERGQLLQTTFDSLDGISKVQLVQAIDQHLAVLGVQNSEFESQLSQVRLQKVGSRQEKANGLKAEAGEINTQIQKLQSQIRELERNRDAKTEEIQVLEVEIGRESVLFDGKRASFKQAYQQVLETLNQDKADITQQVTE